LEILKDVYQMKIPIPDNPLGSINAYLIKTDEGSMLVDTGWNTPIAFDALVNQMQSHGVSLADLKYIFITHIHPDHYGLVGRLDKLTDAKLIIHEKDKELLDSRYIQTDELVDDMEDWMKVNGVPAEEQVHFSRASLGILGYVHVAMPDIVVKGGEKIQLNGFNFEVIWTPGHSPGHICLYEVEKKFLIAGDHILQKITPNISLNNASQDNPLIDYLKSLEDLKLLDVNLVLPAHGDSFSNYLERIDQIKQHHEDRLNEMVKLFNNEPKSAYQIAVETKWYLAWDQLPLFSKRVAVTETLAHLELLVTRGKLNKKQQSGIIRYFLTVK